MIQRIQSLWLFLAFIASGLIFIFPVFVFDNQGSVFIQSFDTIIISEIENYVRAGYVLAGLTALISGLSLANIFFYKKRILQMRICVYNVLLILFLLILTGIFSFTSNTGAVKTFGLSAVLPLIALILNLMARRSIKKDEELVKSVDRIR